VVEERERFRRRGGFGEDGKSFAPNLIVGLLFNNGSKQWDYLIGLQVVSADRRIKS
jgi:hypothetical protein